MLCRKPFNKNGAQFGCGQCMPCRINRRRIWTHRMMLEAVVHPTASFLTLTYNKEHLPSDGSLRPRDMQLFLKRLRYELGSKIRYFGVGEYGDHSWRPHYHLAVFGLDPLASKVVEKSWPYGFVQCGPLTIQGAAYVAGYVTKKMTSVKDERLKGRYPEFARMSLRPGIGAVSVQSVADALQNRSGWDSIQRTGDVPSVLSHGRSQYPLGRYLRRQLRAAMGFENLGSQDNGHEAFRRSAEMLNMYQNYLLAPSKKAAFSVLQEWKREQKIRNMEVKNLIYSQKGKL